MLAPCRALAGQCSALLSLVGLLFGLVGFLFGFVGILFGSCFEFSRQHLSSLFLLFFRFMQENTMLTTMRQQISRQHLS